MGGCHPFRYNSSASSFAQKARTFATQPARDEDSNNTEGLKEESKVSTVKIEGALDLDNKTRDSGYVHSSSEPLRNLIRWVDKPTRRVKRSRFEHDNIKDDYEPLSIESLGKHSHIVVLRDNVAGIEQKEQKQQERVIEELSNEPIDFLVAIEKEVGIAGADEVYKNVCSLKPKIGDRMKTWKELEKLQKELEEGFTLQQLLNYVHDFDKKQVALETKHEPSGDSTIPQLSTHLIRQTRWVPGISETGDKFDASLLRGYTSEASTRKQVAAMLVIRSCWRLDAVEMQGVTGEVEIEVSPGDLEYLVTSKMNIPPLKRISNNLIQTEDEKIEVFRSRRVIRLTGTRFQVQNMINAIVASLENKQTRTVFLPPSLSRTDRTAFTDNALLQLARLTGGNITRVSQNEVQIESDDRHPGSGLSTPADVARRVLLLTSEVADKTERTLACRTTEKPLYAIPWKAQDTMSWLDKLYSWTRCASPMTRMPVEDAQTTEDLDSHELSTPEHAEMVATSNGQDAPASTENAEVLAEGSGWERTPQTQTTAVVGNVLHQVDGVQVDAITTVDLDKAGNGTNSKRIFLPSTTNILELASQLTPLLNSNTSRIIMKFIPLQREDQNDAVLRALPRVNMEFEHVEDGMPIQIRAIKAYPKMYSQDIMLPESALDLSFQQSISHSLPLDRLFQSKEICEFLDRSSLQANGILTPPKIMFDIPSFLIDGAEMTDVAKKDTQASYIFAGLEIRQETAFDYLGWRLRYTSINEGAAGGSRAEVALDYLKTPTTPHVTESKEVALQHFATTAFRLVDALNNPKTAKNQATDPTPLPAAKYCMEGMPDTVECFKIAAEPEMHRAVAQWSRNKL